MSSETRLKIPPKGSGQNNLQSTPPITMLISRRVKPGAEAEFERTISATIDDARKFAGYLGANIFRPANPDETEYRIVFKFGSLSNLRKWEQSAERRKRQAEFVDLTDGSPDVQVFDGFEVWFALPEQKAIAPPRYKMMIVTWLAVFPLVNIGFLLFGSALGHLPLIVRTLLTTAVFVPLMTYLIMPQMTRLFARWLYPPQPDPHTKEIKK